MTKKLRLRQLVIAADSTTLIGKLQHVLQLKTPYADPGVAEFGLTNGVFAIGDQFLEIVVPEKETAPAQRFLDKHGPGGYMAIFQVEDLVGVSRRLADQNVRDVSNNGMYTEIAVGDGGAVHTMRYRTHDPAPLATGSGTHEARTTLTGVQWHPADCGTLLETDQAEPNLPGAVRISLALPSETSG